MKALIAALALLATAGIATAGPTTKTFSRSCDSVWAAEQATLNDGQYRTISLSKEDRTASFVAGGFWGGERTMSSTLSGSGEGCTLTVQSHFSGLAHHDAPDFIKRVESALSDAK